MGHTNETTVRMLAFLHTYCREHDLPTTLTVHIPTEGVRAHDLASCLGLPLDLIECLFLNGRLVGLGAMVHHGDRVAFVPPGTPAPHPAFFGREGIDRYAVA